MSDSHEFVVTISMRVFATTSKHAMELVAPYVDSMRVNGVAIEDAVTAWEYDNKHIVERDE